MPRRYATPDLVSSRVALTMPSGDLGCWHGLAEQVDLGLIACLAAQGLELTIRFNSFGRDRDAKASAHVDDRVYNGLRVLAVGQTCNKGAIDLDFVESELEQVAERRKARAKVIQHDAYTQRAQLV